ncbi:MAG TPA: DUF1648 domain-containing protein [Longimicrobium sp.]
MSIHRARLLNAVLLLALFAGSAWAYPRLPERIPIHFDLTGQPDGWASRSTGWFLLPVIALALAAFLHAVAAYSANHPETWNVPDKRRFLALDPQARAPITAKLRAFVAWVGVVVTAMMCVIQAAVFRAATGASRGLPPWAMAAIVASVLVMVAGGLRLNRVVGRMIREAAG